jgi:hypothetical protein
MGEEHKDENGNNDMAVGGSYEIPFEPPAPANEMHSRIVGNQFRPQFHQNVMDSLNKGVKLVLEREPNNKHDPNATKVLVPLAGGTGAWIGFLPAVHAARLAPIIDKMGADKFEVIVHPQHGKPHLLIRYPINA